MINELKSDVSYTKEIFYKRGSIIFENITQFISLLNDIQAKPGKDLRKLEGGKYGYNPDEFKDYWKMFYAIKQVVL